MSSYRDERSFDKLVDQIISNKLAIRLKVEKVYLLIFPSTMLPSPSKSELHLIYIYTTSFKLYCLLNMSKFLSYSYCRISIKVLLVGDFYR